MKANNYSHFALYNKITYVDPSTMGFKVLSSDEAVIYINEIISSFNFTTDDINNFIYNYKKIYYTSDNVTRYIKLLEKLEYINITSFIYYLVTDYIFYGKLLDVLFDNKQIINIIHDSLYVKIKDKINLNSLQYILKYVTIDKLNFANIDNMSDDKTKELLFDNFKLNKVILIPDTTYKTIDLLINNGSKIKYLELPSTNKNLCEKMFMNLKDLEEVILYGLDYSILLNIIKNNPNLRILKLIGSPLKYDNNFTDEHVTYLQNLEELHLIDYNYLDEGYLNRKTLDPRENYSTQTINLFPVEILNNLPKLNKLYTRAVIIPSVDKLRKDIKHDFEQHAYYDIYYPDYHGESNHLSDYYKKIKNILNE